MGYIQLYSVYLRHFRTHLRPQYGFTLTFDAADIYSRPQNRMRPYCRLQGAQPHRYAHEGNIVQFGSHLRPQYDNFED